MSTPKNTPKVITDKLCEPLCFTCHLHMHDPTQYRHYRPTVEKLLEESEVKKEEATNTKVASTSEQKDTSKAT